MVPSSWDCLQPRILASARPGASWPSPFVINNNICLYSLKSVHVWVQTTPFTPVIKKTPAVQSGCANRHMHTYFLFLYKYFIFLQHELGFYQNFSIISAFRLKNGKLERHKPWITKRFQEIKGRQWKKQIGNGGGSTGRKWFFLRCCSARNRQGCGN